MTSGIQQPIGPGSSSYGLAWKAVTVISVDPSTNTAVVIDQLTKSFTMPLSAWRSKGLPPAQGEIWIVDQLYGKWRWVCMVAGGRPDGEVIHDSTIQALQSLYNASWDAGTIGEKLLFDDTLLTNSRYVARDSIGFQTGTSLTLMAMFGYCRGMTATVGKVSITVAGTGTVNVALYNGTDPSAMAQIATASFSAAGSVTQVTHFGWSSTPVTVPAGWTAVSFSTADTAVRLAGVSFGTTPGILTTRSNVNSQLASASSSPPGTLNMSGSTPYSLTASRIWCALR
jgi:hypothetical protein